MESYKVMYKIFVVKSISFFQTVILFSGDKITFLNYIDEEFEEDDGDNWIKL